MKVSFSLALRSMIYAGVAIDVFASTRSKTTVVDLYAGI